VCVRRGKRTVLVEKQANSPGMKALNVTVQGWRHWMSQSRDEGTECHSPGMKVLNVTVQGWRHWMSQSRGWRHWMSQSRDEGTECHSPGVKALNVTVQGMKALNVTVQGWRHWMTQSRDEGTECHSPQTLNCCATSLKRKYLSQDYIFSNGIYKEIMKISPVTVCKQRNCDRRKKYTKHFYCTQFPHTSNFTALSYLRRQRSTNNLRRAPSVAP
jgi:predicted phage tail protein